MKNKSFQHYDPQISGVETIITDQPSEMVEAVKRILFKPTIKSQSKSEFRAQYTYLPLRNIALNYLEFDKNTTIKLNIPDSFYVVEKVLTGKLEIEHNGQSYQLAKGEANCFLPGGATTICCRERVRCLVITIDREQLESLFVQASNNATKQLIEFDTPMNMDSGAVQSWWRLVAHLEQEFKYADSLFLDGPCVRHIEQTLISSLLLCQQHNYSQLLSRGSSVAPAHVRRAEVFMQAHAQYDINLNDIVAAAAVPERTLFDAFKKFRGLSPMKFLKAVRLQYAHEELTAKEFNKSITEVAHKWGFNHPGRFSSEYKARYGESPMQIIRRNAE